MDRERVVFPTPVSDVIFIFFFYASGNFEVRCLPKHHCLKQIVVT